MKILILCKKFPYPLKEGEPIAISSLSRSLKRKGCEISLLVLNTSKHFFDPKKLPPTENFYKKIYSVRTNNHITAAGAVKNLVSGKSYILSRFYSGEYARQLEKVLKTEKYDVVQLETIYMAHYIPVVREHSKAIVALRAHNVEYLIWERVARCTQSVLKKWYLKYENKFLKKFETAQLNRCDILVAITENDLELFRNMGFQKKGIAIPVGINPGENKTGFNPGPMRQSIAFIGALDWMPNQDGIVWFLENVWPRLHKLFPDLEFHIAGKNTPEWLKERSTDKVIVHGEVANARSFISQHPVFVAPLFSGSGIKIKVLEAMAWGRAVVTTGIGVEGIPAEHGRHLFIANTAYDFLDAIKVCFSEKVDLLKIRKNGRELICQAFDPRQLAGRTIAAYRQLVEDKKGG